MFVHVLADTEGLRIRGVSRWISASLNNFMIRLGYLKFLSYIASGSTRGFDSLTRKMAEMCTKGVDVNLDHNSDIMGYIRRKGLDGQGSKRLRRYSGINAQQAESLRRIEVELQDFYLADRKLPSNLGAVPKDVHHELVQWGTWMGLIHPAKHTLTGDGQLLASLLTEEEKQALTLPDRFNNPFLIRAERLFYLHLKIDLDGGFLRHFVPLLFTAHGGSRFTRLEAVEQLKDSLNALYTELREFRSNQAHAERWMIGKLLGQLEKEDTRSKKSGRRRRPLTGIMRISPRLENLVDLGILSKPDKYKYDYRVSSHASKSFEKIPHFAELDSFLQNSYCSFAGSMFGSNAKHIQDAEEVFSHAKTAYEHLGGRGYRRVRDLSLTASILGLDEGVFFEESDLLETLEEMRRSGSREALLSGGRRTDDPMYVLIRQ
jgi:hypothetical protein